MPSGAHCSTLCGRTGTDRCPVRWGTESRWRSFDHHHRSSRMSPTFASLGVSAELVSALGERGIVTPFPVQALTIPDAVAGRDVCGKARTGSGKTLAFGLPILQRL